MMRIPQPWYVRLRRRIVAAVLGAAAFAAEIGLILFLLGVGLLALAQCAKPVVP